MAVDPKLLVIKPVDELVEVTGLQDGDLLFYDGSGNLKRISIDTFNNLSQTAKPLKPTDATPTEKGLYMPTESGTYANIGLEAQEGYYTLFFFDGSVWTKSENKLPENSVKIPNFEDLNFPVSAEEQCIYNGSIWQLESGETATILDVPKESNKWLTLGSNLELDVDGGPLAYDTFLELAGVEINPSVTIYDADEFDDVIGGYGDDGSGVMQWHPDFTGSRSTQKIPVTAGSVIEIKSMTNTTTPPYKINVLTFLAPDQTTILAYVLNTVAGVIQTQTFTVPQNGYVVGSVANVTFLPQCELKITAFSGFTLPSKVLTAENYVDYLSEKTLQDRILNGDTPTEVLGLSSQRQEVNLIKFKGQNLFYWSEGWLNSIIKVGDYNIDTNTVSNAQTIVNGSITGINSDIFKCPTAFVLNQKVYLIVTVSNPNVFCLLFESTDGKTFTEISRTLADVSGFKNGLFGNHWIIPHKIDGYYYWYIEGINPGDVNWTMKLMRSQQINTGWQVVGTVQGLNAGTGAKGGPCVIYQDGKFKMVYHYSPSSSNLPTWIAYAEADVNDPLYFKQLYSPLTAIVHKPFGNMTDQYADPELCEIDGRTFLFCSIVDNTTPRSIVYRWECDGRLSDILNSKI